MDNNLSESGVSDQNSNAEVQLVEKKRNDVSLVIILSLIAMIVVFAGYLLYMRLLARNPRIMKAYNQTSIPSPIISQPVPSKIKITDRDGNVRLPAYTLNVNPLGSSVNWQLESASQAANLNYNEVSYSVSEYPNYTKGKLLADGTYTVSGKTWKGSLQVKDLSATDSAIDVGNLKKPDGLTVQI